MTPVVKEWVKVRVKEGGKCEGGHRQNRRLNDVVMVCCDKYDYLEFTNTKDVKVHHDQDVGTDETD